MVDLSPADFLPVGIEPTDFEVPLICEGEPSHALFLDDRPLTSSDKEWVKLSAQAIQQNPGAEESLKTLAPTRTALTALDNALNRYSGPMPGTKESWQNYVMSQYYMQSLDPDPKVSKPALDALARTSVVGLHEERKEITLELKSTVDLQSDALQLLRTIAQRETEKVIEGEVM